MPRVARKFAFVAGLVASAASAAAADNWTSSSGGSWSQTQFWSDGAIPARAEDVNVTPNLSALSSCSVAEDVNYTPQNAIGNLVVNQTALFGTVQLALNSAHADLYAANETVGSSGSGKVVQSGNASNAMTGSLTLASGAGSGAYYDFGGLAVTAGGETIGLAGTATFEHRVGTNAIGNGDAPGDLRLGVLAGSTGTYDLTAGTLNVTGTDYVALAGNAYFNQDGGTHTDGGLVVGKSGSSRGGDFRQTAGTYVTGNIQNYGSITQTADGGTFTANYVNNLDGDFVLNHAFTIKAGFYNTGSAQFGGTQTWLANTDFYNDSGGTTFLTDPNANGEVTRAAVTGGAVNFDSIVHLKSLALSGKGTATVDDDRSASATPGARFLQIGTLGFDQPTASTFAGQLDLVDNKLIVDSIAPAQFNAYVHSGYAGGAWTGTGVLSTSANASHGVGFAVTGSGVTAHLALYGDADLSGSVDFSDLLAVARAYGQSNTFWSGGDFNYDGKTDFADLLTLARNYGSARSAEAGVPADIAADWALAQALVPEPGAISILASAVASLHRRRRRPVKP